jgi:ribosomal protein S30
MLSASIKNLHFSSTHFRSLTTTSMSSYNQNPGSFRRYNPLARPPAKSSQIPGLNQAVVADAVRRQTPTVVPKPQNADELPPTQKENRHFTDRKFADASISPASKKAINHE